MGFLSEKQKKLFETQLEPQYRFLEEALPQRHKMHFRKAWKPNSIAFKVAKFFGALKNALFILRLAFFI